jgi:carboxypeptidase PM20D1
MDTMDSAKAYIEKTVNNDKVEITVLRGMNPSRISRTDCEEYKKLERAVASTWQGALVSPYLMVQCSDSRHYGKISDRVYRFSAMALTSEERKTIHGNNERIKIENISKAVEFYIRLLKMC